MSNTMPNIELIYDNDCPNVEVARAQLQEALVHEGLKPKWKEWVRQDPYIPSHVPHYGSPTILIDGHDVGGGSPTSGTDRCRLYPDEKGRIHKTPTVQMILSALKAEKEIKVPLNGVTKNKIRWKRLGAVFPLIGAVFIPGLTCPACWPAYAGLLSALGIGFFNYTPYLLPLMIIFVMITLSALGYRAKERHGYHPLILGIFSSIILIIGKFVLDSNWILYGGIAILIAASVWNSWPVKQLQKDTCSSCPPKEITEQN